MAEYIKREDAEIAITNYLGATSVRASIAANCILNPVKAADVRENVRGKWNNICNYDKKMGTNYNRWMCSNCGFRAKHGFEHTRAGRRPEYNFCPNCGADMRGDDNGEIH